MVNDRRMRRNYRRMWGSTNEYCLFQRAILLLTVVLPLAAAKVLPEEDATSHPKIYSTNSQLEFFESGFPLITSDSEKYFIEEDYFPFTPECTIVSNIGHKLIKMEHPHLFHIGLYENEFPEGAHYKFHVNFTSIQRCDKEENCKDMEKCFTDVQLMKHFQNVSDTIIGLSWEKQNKFITILFQYRNKFTKCYGHSPFGLSKIVLKDNNAEHVAFRSLELSPTPFSTQESISLKSNLKVYALFGDCWNMTISHGDVIHQFKTVRRVAADGITNWIAWNEIILCNKTKEDQFNITLNNVTECRDDQAVVMLIPHDNECEVHKPHTPTKVKRRGENYSSSTTFSCPTVIIIIFIAKFFFI